MEGDTPISLIDISQMDDKTIDAMLTNIRERRMKPVRVYEEMSLLQAAARRENLDKQLTKQLEMFIKERDRADKAMDKLEARSTKLRALRLEIEAT